MSTANNKDGENGDQKPPESTDEKVTYAEEGRWILIENYQLPHDLPWNRKKTNVCFQIPVAYPGTPPYGFYVPSGILYENNVPKSYQEPAKNKPPFPPEKWGFFSWTQEGWKATDDSQTGSNILSFVVTFKNRFLEGG